MAQLPENIKESLLQAIATWENKLSQAKFRLKDKLHLIDPIEIQPYYGFGNAHEVYLKGRVLENEKIKEGKKEDGTLQHLKNTYKRYESDEIPGVRVKASFGGQDIVVETNDEGFFDFQFTFDQPIDYTQTRTTVKLTLLDHKTDTDETEAEGKVFVPDKNAEFGIISDIDDTVLVSNITHFLGRLKLMLLKNASQRSPFPGVAAFLRALCKGSDGQGHNPIFFVSGSEWNLFDLLVNFFRSHNIPEGPLFLRDKGANTDKQISPASEQEYKQQRIRLILDTYPNLRFICIGDSGQHDPEIYQTMVQQYPGRILGVYIRDVSPEKRDQQVHQIAKKVEEQGSQMLLAPETVTAADHALSMGWINQDQLAEIKQECEQDDQSN